jgi:phage terminase small subunit
MPLSNKQQVFVAEYLKCWNATEAARRAGYSEKYLHTNASKLLQNTTIVEEIEARKAELMMSADEVLIRLTEQARSEYTDYIQANGTVNIVQMIADGKQHLIKGIKHTLYGINYEFHDAQSALVHIGKHRGLFDGDADGTKDKPIHVKFIKGASSDDL